MADNNRRRRIPQSGQYNPRPGPNSQISPPHGSMRQPYNNSLGNLPGSRIPQQGPQGLNRPKSNNMPGPNVNANLTNPNPHGSMRQPYNPNLPNGQSGRIPQQGNGQIPNQPGPNANIHDQQTPSPGRWAGNIRRYNPKGNSPDGERKGNHGGARPVSRNGAMGGRLTRKKY
tara:strand:- start:125 stop:640 length:516 start_codon:yes stop_codon:yes gene_type:complete